MADTLQIEIVTPAEDVGVREPLTSDLEAAHLLNHLLLAGRQAVQRPLQRLVDPPVLGRSRPWAGRVVRSWQSALKRHRRSTSKEQSANARWEKSS